MNAYQVKALQRRGITVSALGCVMLVEYDARHDGE